MRFISGRHGKTSRRRTMRWPVLATLVVTGGFVTGHPAQSLAGPLLHHGVDGHVPASRLAVAGVLPLVLILLGLALVGFVCAHRRWRRAAVCSLAGLLVVFAVEAAVHSVHHLDDPVAGQTCAVLASGHHVEGVSETPQQVVGPSWNPYLAPTIDADLVASLQWFRPDEGRAPPAVLSR
jgi:hypothetical protein